MSSQFLSSADPETRFFILGGRLILPKFKVPKCKSVLGVTWLPVSGIAPTRMRPSGHVIPDLPPRKESQQGQDGRGGMHVARESGLTFFGILDLL